MPTVQTNYPLRQDAYSVGSPVMSRYDSDSAVVETAAGIGFGQPVQRGADPRGMGLLAAGVFMGIAIADPGVAGTGTAQAVDKYVQYKPGAYMTKGSIAVLADLAVAVETPVYWNPATGRYSQVTTGGNVACTGWVFDTIATAAGQLVSIIKR